MWHDAKNQYVFRANSKVIFETQIRKMNFIFLSRDVFVKGPVHCFSQQVVMNKYFLVNPEKQIGSVLSCRFREKRKNRKLCRTPVPKNDVTEPKARLKTSKGQFGQVSFSNLLKVSMIFLKQFYLQMVAEANLYWLLA